MGDRALAEIIRRAASGDEHAARTLAERYENALRAQIHRRIGQDLRPRIGTSDIFSATMMAVLTELPSLEYRGEAAFVGWMRAIAERQILMAARYHGARKRDVRRERFEGSSPGHIGNRTSPSEGAVRAEITQLIREAVIDLPAPERRVVELHSFEGASFARVAKEMGLSGPARARYVFQRALKLLGRMLDDDGA